MALNSGIFLLLSSLLLSSFIDSFVFSVAQARNGGFSLDLVHRDSPKSPFHSPSSSRFERLRGAFSRSLSRAASLNHNSVTPATIESEISSGGGEYLMKVSIGTPPVEITAIADTGSDVTWTQCKPCTDCYKQKDPLFDPRKTSSFRQVSCDSSPCQAVGASTCDDSNRCRYQLTYGDKSYSVGDLATETFTFDSTSGRSVSIPKVVFGCGHNNVGTFKEMGSGIVGLGGGELSIVKQLDKQISGKFSYCLVPINTESNITSKINFGNNAKIHDDKFVTTPLIKKRPDTFYYLNLEKVSVGTKSLAFKKSSSKLADSVSAVDEGNIIIDSGTTLTILPTEFYQDLESTLREKISAEPTTDPQGLFGLCYNSGDQDISFPKIVLHFTDADVILPPSNTFLEVEEGLVCLTIVASSSDDIAILGNISQMNFLIEYDLEDEKLSFSPTDCTKQ